jgi:hypothetical protein
VANRVGTLLSRAGRSAKNWISERTSARSALRLSQNRCDAYERALRNAVRDLGIVGDHVLQLEAHRGGFDAKKVLVEAHTKKLFKGAMPTIIRAIPETHTLQVHYGRNQGVIAGMAVCITSRLGNYSERYLLQERDIRDDHLCFRPPELDLGKTRAEDLILSFVPPIDLSEVEKAIALVLDITGSAVDECTAVLGDSEIDPARVFVSEHKRLEQGSGRNVGPTLLSELVPPK